MFSFSFSKCVIVCKQGHKRQTRMHTDRKNYKIFANMDLYARMDIHE